MSRQMRHSSCALYATCLGLALAGPIAAQEKSARSSSPAAAQLYRDAANFQNNDAFDLAAEEWQKFLKNHPQDPQAARAQHYLGVCQLQLKQWEAAAASFEKVLKDYPKFEFREDALLNLGLCQYSLATGKAELYAKAAETFQTLLTESPKSKHAEEALYYQGEALYSQGKKQEAAAAYARLVHDFEKAKRRADALYALGVAQEELGQHAEAGKTYDVYLKEFAERPLATEVRMRKAETILQAGDFAAAEKIFGEVARAENFAAADHALSRQAYCLAKLDKFEQAGALYAKLATEFPRSPAAADAALSAGRSYYRAEKLAEARPWFERVIERKGSGSPEAAHWLCRILIKDGKAAEAAALAQQQVAGAKDSPFAANLALDQADALYELPNQRAEALDLYAKFAADRPQHELAPQALYYAAFTAQDLKQYDVGLKHAAAFLTAYPQDKFAADVKYVAAECNVQLKKYGEADRLFRELIAQHAGHADVDAWRVRLGLVAYLDKKYDAAIAALSPVAEALKAPDDQAEAQFLIGASQFFTDKFADAASALAASLAANPQWKQADEALLLLARAQSKLGKTADARARLRKFLADYPNSALVAEAHYRLGEVAYAAEEFPDAIAAYQTVTTKFAQSPLAPHALSGLGWAQFKSQEYKSGAESFTALLTRFPEHQLQADARLGRAMCRRLSGDPKGAITDIDDYFKTNPDQPQQSAARYERGLAQVAASDFADAVTTLEKLLADDPKYTAADAVLYEIGWALKSQDKHAEAAAAFARLAANHANSPFAAEAAVHVGDDLYDKKQYAEAAKAYETARVKSPAGELGEKATYKLGWANYQQQKYADALAQFSEQLAAHPAGPLAADAVFMTAECLFKQEKYQEAWPAYQAALQKKSSSQPMEILTYLHGGQSAAQNKQWDQSIKLLEVIPAKFAESPLVAEALYELGWAKQNLGQTAEAVTSYTAAAEKSRDHVGARSRFMIGELLFGQKKHDEAIKEFQRGMFGYGGDQATAETKNWQAKSGYEAGRCAEVQIAKATDAAAKQKHLADATRFYTFVAEKHPNHQLAAEAKNRLAALSKL